MEGGDDGKVRAMAFAWIKIEDTTPDKPEVWAMAAKLGIDADAVVGKLVRIWIWADHQTIDGNAQSVTKALLDRCAGVVGFADAMMEAGWLVATSAGVSFVNFDRHNGETAKKRAQTSRRVQRHRAQSGHCNAASVTSGVTKALPEKRREEKTVEQVNTETQAHTAKPVRCVFRKPSVQDVQEYVTSICANVDAAAFVDYYTANGWRVGRSGMKDWKAAVRNWHKRNEEQQSNDHGQQAIKAGFTAQARQDAQWAVFREFDAAATRDTERAIAGSADGSPTRIAGNHASLFGEESGADDPF